MSELPHLNDDGDVHMVDVSGKDDTVREAVAETLVVLADATAELLFGGDLKKGDALASIRLAGIMAAKKTPELIPLCHPVALSAVSVDIERTDTGALITTMAKTTGPTGIEMEAMTAASVAALALYDMVKGVERGVVIGPTQLLKKSGGRSGTWER
jgi:cyclic pyranopterin phosphate synthase